MHKELLIMNIRTCYLVPLLIIHLLFFSACNQSEHKDKAANLRIISDISAYNKLVNEDSSNQLVNLEKIIPGIILDIRYATENNFTGEQIYNSPKAFVRKPVAEALAIIQKELNEEGLGLKVFDAYRPYTATVKFYEVYPDTNFVAAPWKGSVHNRGCAVDITLINLKTNKQLEMPTPFDDFTVKASHSFNDLPKKALKNRQTLRDIMTEHGFQIYEAEWWHYGFKGWEKYELMDISFDELNN